MRRCITILALLMTGLLLLGCPNLVGGNDENGDPPEENGEAEGPFVGDYEVDVDFVMHVWSCEYTDEPTHELDESDDALRVTAKDLEWSGGSFAARVEDEGFATGFDFSEVKYLEFEVRGDVPAGQLEVFLQEGEDNLLKEPVTEHGVESLSETEWTEVSIDVSDESETDVTSAFTHMFEATVAEGTWAEFREIDWVDADGDSVDIVD